MALAAMLVAASAGYMATVSGETRVSDLLGPQVQLNPEATGVLARESFSALANYYPRLVGSDSGHGGWAALHRLRLLGEFHPDSNQSFVLEERLARGTQDFSLLTLAAEGNPVSLDASATATAVSYEQSETTGTWKQHLPGRLNLRGTSTWSVGGGTDPAARVALPYSHTLSGALGVGHETPGQALYGTLAAYHSSFSNGRLTREVQLTADFRRLLPRSLELLASAGGALVNYDRRTTAVPTVSVSLSRKAPSLSVPFWGSLLVRVAPVVDPTTGEMHPRADAVLLASLRLRTYLSLAGTGGVSISPSEASRREVAVGGLSLVWRVRTDAAVTAGVRSTTYPQRVVAGFVGFGVGTPHLPREFL